MWKHRRFFDLSDKERGHLHDEAFVCGALILVVVLLLALSHLPTQAAGNLHVFVDCIDRSGGMTHVWFGYSASENGKEPTFSYIDDGAGIYITDVTKGTHRQVADAILNSDETEIPIRHFSHLQQRRRIQRREGEREYQRRGLRQRHRTTRRRPFHHVTKDVAPGTYLWEIRDEWGPLVERRDDSKPTEGDRTFVRLVLGPDNANTNPDDYRVTAQS